MSWELTSFLVLGAVLVAGFAWYERSRPPSQVVALVAALAALAIAGRIAFAAFPNVKPTTDIVIFAGYALGGAPGFAVGALTALVSNFWFGQGPWTPWQMAGWGLCGLLGAALGLGGRNAGRLLLASTCGLAALLYGALLNFSVMATSGGELSWRYFGVLEGRAVPFEAAHLLGNVAFALLAGPALVRMLARFRRRFEWQRRQPPRDGSRGFGPALRRGGVAAVLLAGLALAALAPSRAEAANVGRAAAWLESAQNADGGFGPSPGGDSGAETTCWVMLGLEAAGRNPLDVSRGGRTPVDFLRSEADELASPGDLARTILALEGAGVDAHHFGGRNLVAALLAKERQDGSYMGWPGSTAFAAIALRAAGVKGVDKSLDWLRQVQNGDGGWGDVPGSPSTADGTGAVLQALSADSQASKAGVRYLERHQRAGGGFALGGNGAVNTQSTAWAVQGLLAAGRDPGAFKQGGDSALDYMTANQEEDGHFRYSGASDQTPVWVTGQVLVAVAGEVFPVSPAPRAPKPKPARSPAPAPAPTEPAAIPPAAIPPATLPPSATETPPASPGASPGGAAPAAPSAPAAGAAGGAQPLIPPNEAGVPEGSSVPLPTEPAGAEPLGEPAAETTGAGDGESSTAGAIVLGLLAGCLLFAAGLAGRRGWLRWRYGI